MLNRWSLRNHVKLYVLVEINNFSIALPKTKDIGGISWENIVVIDVNNDTIVGLTSIGKILVTGNYAEQLHETTETCRPRKNQKPFCYKLDNILQKNIAKTLQV